MAMRSLAARPRPYASAAAVGSLMMRRTSRPATRPATLVAARCSSLKFAGTVMTARSTVSPRARSAISLPRPFLQLEGKALAPAANLVRAPGTADKALDAGDGVLRIDGATLLGRVA